MMINVKKNEANYFNITDIQPVDESNYEDNDEEENEYKKDTLENELFKEDSYYVEEDDDLDFLDDDIFELDGDDLPEWKT